MSNRQYVCNLWPELVIGAKIKFMGGFFETSDEKLQHLIESRDAFGTSIHYKDSLEEMEANSRLQAEHAANDKARKRQELLDALDELERDEGKEAAKEIERQRQEEEDHETENLLKAADTVVEANEPELINGPGPDAPSAFGGIEEAKPRKRK